jgi:uncharacterized membrane protein
MASAPSSRLAYIDWLRGLACVLMFQTHCYDAWLGGAARNSRFYSWSQLGGTFPAPLFLFLAGVSLSIVADKLLRKHARPREIPHRTIRRGGEILALGILFRLQEFLIAWGWAPWSDLFRVDILNTIGVSLMLMGGLSGIVLWLASASRRLDRARIWLVVSGAVSAAVISALAPLLWTKWRPRFLPWELETYLDGAHNLGKPQAWLFPLFPWSGFAFAGLAIGFFLFSDYGSRLGARAFVFIGLAGALLIGCSKAFDAANWQLYPVYDYWHTSPEFFILRVGMLFLLLSGSYAWCRWGPGTWAFSPLIQLGQTSLLVYWVHIEFVYGRFTILPRQANNIATASAGLLTIFLAMLALSVTRTRLRRLPAYRTALSPTRI